MEKILKKTENRIVEWNEKPSDCTLYNMQRIEYDKT
jgi:hypothetical protein